MNLIQKIREVFRHMLGKDDIKDVLHVMPAVSGKMKEKIELWESMYKDQAFWLNEDVHSLGIASLVAGEKARMATLEMNIKITGDGEKADFIKETFKDVTTTIRKQLEYGIALGSLVIKPYVVLGPDNKYKIKFEYTKANNFYPLAFSADNHLTSAAFLDRIINGKKVYTKLEVQTLQSNQVTIQNRAFEADYSDSYNSETLGNEIMLNSVPEWADLIPEVTIDNTDTLMFAYFRNPDANTVDLDSPLGVSGFARATDLIRQADEQFSNLLWEFKGGQLAIDVDWTALNPIRDQATGKENYVLPKLAQRLFRHDLDLGDDNAYNVYSPTLRDTSIINGLNNILMHIEDKTALSRGTISEVTTTEARTATELKILKQRAYAENVDIQTELQNCFENIFKILDVYCKLYNIVPDGDYEVAYDWDDSILTDKDSERQNDIIDINNGLMSKVEYRMKWMGETKTQAEEALKAIQQESMNAIQLQQVMMTGTTDAPNSNQATDKQSNIDKQNRANESNETTKKQPEEKKD